MYWLARFFSGICVQMSIQYTTAQTLRKLLKRTLVKKSGAVPGPEGESGGQYTDSQYTTAQDMFWVSGGQYTDSVHNRTSLEKVTQAYFSLEKREGIKSQSRAVYRIPNN